MQSLGITELKHLFDIMSDMHRHACCANWEALSRLDQQRRVLLGYDSQNGGAENHTPTVSLCQSGSDDELQAISINRSTDKEQLGSLIEKIQLLDTQIIKEAQAARAKWMAENRGLSAQVQAKKQYAQTSSFT